MMEKELIGYIKNFQLSDLLGFARIVGAEETKDFEDFVTEVVMKFLEMPKVRLMMPPQEMKEWNKDYAAMLKNVDAAATDFTFILWR